MGSRRLLEVDTVVPEIQRIDGETVDYALLLVLENGIELEVPDPDQNAVVALLRMRGEIDVRYPETQDYFTVYDILTLLSYRARKILGDSLKYVIIDDIDETFGMYATAYFDTKNKNFKGIEAGIRMDASSAIFLAELFGKKIFVDEDVIRRYARMMPGLGYGPQEGYGE